MQVTKIAAAIAISTGLLTGCNTDLRDAHRLPHQQKLSLS